MENKNPNRLHNATFLPVPNWLASKNDINSTVKLLYGRLCQYAGDKNSCNPGQLTLAKEIGISKSQVIRSLNTLKKYGLITSKKTKSSSIYILIDHEWITMDNDNHDDNDISPVQHSEKSRVSTNATEDVALMTNKDITEDKFYKDNHKGEEHNLNENEKLSDRDKTVRGMAYNLYNLFCQEYEKVANKKKDRKTSNHFWSSANKICTLLYDKMLTENNYFKEFLNIIRHDRNKDIDDLGFNYMVSEEMSYKIFKELESLSKDNIFKHEQKLALNDFKSQLSEHGKWEEINIEHSGIDKLYHDVIEQVINAYKKYGKEHGKIIEEDIVSILTKIINEKIYLSDSIRTFNDESRQYIKIYCMKIDKQEELESINEIHISDNYWIYDKYIREYIQEKLNDWIQKENPSKYEYQARIKKGIYGIDNDEINRFYSKLKENREIEAFKNNNDCKSISNNHKSLEEHMASLNGGEYSKSTPEGRKRFIEAMNRRKLQE